MDKKKQVEEILLSPINVIGYKGNAAARINKVRNKIETTQSYYPYKNYPINLDADMSDFAIGFYEIIYKDFLENEILKETDALFNEEFAGDTMNSFNSIANTVPGAGKSSARRTERSEWPKYLQEYYDQYHCLANFWVLPMVVGRKADNKYYKAYSNYYSVDGGTQDYMDRFLKVLKDNFGVYKESYPDYFRKLDSFEDFLNVNYINDVYYKDGCIVDYSSLEAEERIERITDNIKGRAKAISNSKHIDELWKYFDSLGLFLKND